MLENRLSVVEYDVKSQAEKIALLTAQRREWLTDQIRAFFFLGGGVHRRVRFPFVSVGLVASGSSCDPFFIMVGGSDTSRLSSLIVWGLPINLYFLFTSRPGMKEQINLLTARLNALDRTGILSCVCVCMCV